MCSLSAGKAAERNLGFALYKDLLEENIHVATVSRAYRGTPGRLSLRLCIRTVENGLEGRTEACVQIASSQSACPCPSTVALDRFSQPKVVCKTCGEADAESMFRLLVRVFALQAIGRQSKGASPLFLDAVPQIWAVVLFQGGTLELESNI